MAVPERCITRRLRRRTRLCFRHTEGLTDATQQAKAPRILLRGAYFTVALAISVGEAVAGGCQWT